MKLCISVDICGLVAFDVFLGISLFSYSSALPIINCGYGWTYGRHLSGTGCLRELSRSYSQRTCLLNGHHITLIQVPWDDVRRRDMYCVKEENLAYELENRHKETTTPDLKIDIQKEIDNAKEGLPKALGCCLDGIQPSG